MPMDQPLVWTSSAVKAELARVRVILDTVNQDISAASGKHQVSDDEWRQWRQLYDAAHHFVDTASTLWGSNAIQARDYEQQAGKWRDMVKSRGGTTSGPSDIVRKPTTNWDTATIVVAAVVGLVILKFWDHH
jgi:hypothetical protein